MENLDVTIEKALLEFNLQEQDKEYLKQNLKNKLQQNDKHIQGNTLQNDYFFYSSIKLCIENEINILQVKKDYEVFKKGHMKKVYMAIFFGIILPILATNLIFQLKYKLLILIFVIISILVSCFYIIVLEYIDYSYKKSLNIEQ